MDDLERHLMTLEQDANLLAEEAYSARVAALETLEADILDRIASLKEEGGGGAALPGLRRRAKALQARLVQADAALFARLREGIRRGALRGAPLRRELLRLAPSDGDADPADVGYDALDALIAGVLLDEAPPATVRPELRGWEPEMVPYQPTPARIVLELAARLRPDEVFVDLGSGLGQVCVLVHLLAGAPTIGVEIDPMLWAYGVRLACRLDLEGVTFLPGDARDVDLAPGTYFFLYTPFSGALLQSVLERLHGVAGRHAIRVASYGPCTPAVARQAWLVPDEASHSDPNRPAFFRSQD